MIRKEELKIGAVVIRVPANKQEGLIENMNNSNIGCIYTVTEIGVNFFSVKMIYDDSPKTEYFNPYGENKNYEFFKDFKKDDIIIEMNSNILGRIINVTPNSDKIAIVTRDGSDYVVTTKSLRKVFDDKAAEKFGVKKEEPAPVTIVETPAPVKKVEPEERIEVNAPRPPMQEQRMQQPIVHQQNRNIHHEQPVQPMNEYDEIEEQPVQKPTVQNKARKPVSPLDMFNSTSIWSNHDLVFAFGKKSILAMAINPINSKLVRNKEQLKALVTSDDYTAIAKLADENMKLNKLIQELSNEQEVILKEICKILYNDPDQISFSVEDVIEKALGIPVR